MTEEVLQLKDTLRELKRYNNRKRSPTRSARIRQVKRQIRQIDTDFRKQLGHYDPKRHIYVKGFTFPLASEEDLERLELAVDQNASIRAQFVNYLRKKKPFSKTVVESFGMFFTDEVLQRFNWKGVTSRDQSPRKAMMNYHIFTDCMEDAWISHGVQKDELQNALRQAVSKIRRRRNANNFARKKRSLERSANYGPNSDDQIE